MNESWREFLYPLGFLSSIAFALRFCLQWIASERQGKSVVSKAFWRISLAGNLLLLAHSLIQSQLHVCLIQGLNAVISCRNLDLMHKNHRLSRYLTLASLAAISAFIPILFHVVNGDSSWLSIPSFSLWKKTDVLPLWHVLGCAGLALFNCRFWVQWWNAEKRQESYLSPAFWWLSLIGDLLCLIYFIQIGDLVNLAGPAVGFLPYLRNLMLIYRKPRKVHG